MPHAGAPYLIKRPHRIDIIVESTQKYTQLLGGTEQRKSHGRCGGQSGGQSSGQCGDQQVKVGIYVPVKVPVKSKSQ